MGSEILKNNSSCDTGNNHPTVKGPKFSNLIFKYYIKFLYLHCTADTLLIKSG